MASIQLSDNSWFGWNMILLFRPFLVGRVSPAIQPDPDFEN